MKLRTYQAESMAAALAQVKSDLGRHAVILHTRSFTRRAGLLRLRKRTIVEITATDQPRPAAAPRSTTPRRDSVGSTAIARDTSVLRSAASAASTTPIPEVRTSPAAPTIDASSITAQKAAQLTEEIETIRLMVSDVLTETRRGKLPDFPNDLLSMYTRLIGQHVADEIARRLVDDVRAAVAEDSPHCVADASQLRASLMSRIATMLPDSSPLTLDTIGRPKVVALIGPTGVGKTTTIAKLAAHFRLRENRRVGLITVDTYRIAAIEQLKVYANILEVPLMVVMSPADMTAAIEQLRDCELILIDTAGRSQRDVHRIDELKQYIDAAKPDETHLVISTTAGEKTVFDIIQSFAPVAPQRLIFTKLDEAVGFGLILNVLANVGMRVSYLTNGQSVPNDIEVANGQRLAELILGTSEPRPAADAAARNRERAVLLNASA